MKIDDARKKIDTLDKEIVDLFYERMKQSREIAAIKAAEGLALDHPGREEEILGRLSAQHEDMEPYTRELYGKIFELSKEYQRQCMEAAESAVPAAKGEPPAIADRVAPSLADKVMSAGEAAQLIRTGMTVGVSGFTSVGYPKAVPAALAASGHAKDLTLLAGASLGDEVDGVLSRAGLVAKRFGYQSNKDMRAAINRGEVGYADHHISHFPWYVREGNGPRIHAVVIECTAVTEKGIIPPASAGCSDALIEMADTVILEVNTNLPMGLAGMHDICDIGRPPAAKIIPVTGPMDRAGTPYIPCPPEKIGAIVLSSLTDEPQRFKPVTPETAKIGEHVAAFLRAEVEAGRMPQSLGPIQSGVGSVGNAVLASLAKSGFTGLSMYTEVMQDAAFGLLESGVLACASASSVTLGEENKQRFYEQIERFRDRIVIRNVEISNHPEVIRRLGAIALNTPIEVDIYGNVNSTHTMGTKIMNGIGGSGDFARNAALTIFAAESTAKGGAISRIVPMVSHVDHTEHDVDVIITEQGVADLRWKTPKERAALLIENCAHPSYRPLLREYYEHALATAPGRHTPHDLAESLSWHLRYEKTGSMLK